MTLSQELDRFLLAKHARKASTTRTYAEILHPFVLFCTKQENDIIPSIHDFLASRTLAPATYNQYLSSITTFLYERRLISRDDRDELHRSRARIEPQLYSEHALAPDQVTGMFTYLRNENARTNHVRQQRDLCIFLLQYACALRISEVLTLHRADVCDDPARNAVMVRIRKEHSKNGMERVVPLRYRFAVAGISIAAELKAWMQISPGSPLLFFNLRRDQYGTPIRYRRMIKKYNNIMQRLGIRTVGATHAMRHTRITELASNPAIPLPVISEFAGHISKGRPNIRTTSLYIKRPDAGDVAEFV